MYRAGTGQVLRPTAALPRMGQQRAREDQRRGPAKKPGGARRPEAERVPGTLRMLPGSFSGIGERKEEDRAGRVQNVLPLRGPSLLLRRRPLGMWPSASPWVGRSSPSPGRNGDHDAESIGWDPFPRLTSGPASLPQFPPG